MKFFLTVMLSIFWLVDSTNAFAGQTQFCTNRVVSVEIDTKQIDEVKSLFSIKSDLPFEFEVSKKDAKVSTLKISFRRPGAKDQYSEPSLTGFHERVMQSLKAMGFKKHGIKKVSTVFLPDVDC